MSNMIMPDKPASDMFATFFRYQAWANAAFFDKIDQMDRLQNAMEFRQVIRLMNHAYVVAEIFAAHLTGRAHGYEADNTAEAPDPATLRLAVATVDKWYLDYVHQLTRTQLAERIAFSFTDDDRGYMSREEMIMHILLHGGYHRGEVGRILTQLSLETPWDTFAVFLHRSDPDRRQQGAPVLP